MTPRLLAAGSSPIAFLAPAGLWLAALLAPLVVLYILKVRRQKKKIASTWLWATAQRDLMARSPFKKLIPQVPLFVQALALLLLALALARPATRGRALLGDHLAIILDASASMEATATGQPAGTPGVETRLDAAKKLAKDLVAALPPGSDALVLEAGREARLAAPLDRDAVRLKNAIDHVKARAVEGDLGAAVALAVDRLRQLGGDRRIVVITDGNLARPASLEDVSLPIEVHKVGTQVENAGIVRVDVRSGTDSASKKEQVQAFLLVANFGGRARELYVTMREQNASDTLASRRIIVQPGERLPVVLTFNPTKGDYRQGLILELSPHDALPVDDVAYARVPAGDKLPVFVAAAEADKANPWMLRALASDPMAEVTSGSLASLAAPGTVPIDGVVVVDGACPDDPPGGDLVILDPPPGSCHGTVVGATLDHPLLTSWENADPRLRFLTLDGVHVSKAHALKPGGAPQELVRTQEGPIVTDISSTARYGTLIGFDVGDSDWPLKASFVLFVRNLLEQARTHRAHGATGPARAGEPMRITVPSSATKVKVKPPSGDEVEVAVRGGLAVLPDVQAVGLYLVSWEGPQPGSMVVPANLTSEAESDLSAKELSVSKSASVEVVAAGAQPDAHDEWVWVLALAAFAFVLFDVWWLTREPRVRGLVPAMAGKPLVPERKEKG